MAAIKSTDIPPDRDYSEGGVFDMRYLFASIAVLLFAASGAVAGPLHDAARDGDVERAKQLMDEGAVVAELDAAGEPALLIASLAGHADVVALLLDRGTAI